MVDLRDFTLKQIEHRVKCLCDLPELEVRRLFGDNQNLRILFLARIIDRLVGLRTANRKL